MCSSKIGLVALDSGTDIALPAFDLKLDLELVLSFDLRIIDS